MTTVIILIILACALPETSASIVSASRPCPLAVTVTQVLRREIMVLMVMMVMMVLMVMVVMVLMVVILALTVTQVLGRDVDGVDGDACGDGGDNGHGCDCDPGAAP